MGSGHMYEIVFQDELVRATDLNRGSGQILDKAAHGPVTIVRNDESFALMKRDLAASWRKEASFAVHVTEIVWNALVHGTTMPPEFQWISAFDEGDRQQIAHELMNAYRKATRDGSWDELEALIHEWSESGWAALNPEVRQAFEATTTTSEQRNR